MKRRNNTGFSRIPSRLAHRARPIRQYWTDATLSRLLPPSPATPGSGYLQLHPTATTMRRWRSFTPIRDTRASWRTIIFCKDRTCAQSRSCVALKIRCRNRRTSALVSAPVDGVPVPGLVLGSVHVPGTRRHRGGGKGVSRHVSNLSFGSGGHLRRPLKGSPAHVSNPFGSGSQVRYPASYPPADHLEGQPPRQRFPVAFRQPAFASWASYSRQRN